MSTDDYGTPPDTWNPLEEFFGGPVGLDPCSNDRSIVRSRRRYTAAGLHLPWDERTIFFNPPYSNILPWIKKNTAELKKRHRGKHKYSVALLPVATSTVWWEIAMADLPYVVFPKRISFLDENGVPEKGCRFDPVLLLFGGTVMQEARFLHLFAHRARMAFKVTKEMVDGLRAAREPDDDLEEQVA